MIGGHGRLRGRVRATPGRRPPRPDGDRRAGRPVVGAGPGQARPRREPPGRRPAGRGLGGPADRRAVAVAVGRFRRGHGGRGHGDRGGPGGGTPALGPGTPRPPAPRRAGGGLGHRPRRRPHRRQRGGPAARRGAHPHRRDPDRRGHDRPVPRGAAAARRAARPAWRGRGRARPPSGPAGRRPRDDPARPGPRPPPPPGPDPHRRAGAALALGLPRGAAALERPGPAAAPALVPPLDQTRTVGLVTLPGAFVGVLLGGGTPVQAGAAQLLVLIGLLAAETIAVWVMTELVAHGRILEDVPR